MEKISVEMPQRISVEWDGKVNKVSLRRNIEEFNQMKAEGGFETTFHYEEVSFTIEEKDNLQEYLILNFDELFDKYDQEQSQNSNIEYLDINIEERVTALEAALKALMMMGVNDSETIHIDSMDNE